MICNFRVSGICCMFIIRAGVKACMVFIGDGFRVFCSVSCVRYFVDGDNTLQLLDQWTRNMQYSM